MLLGDVAGKGVPAALIMVRFSVEVRAALLTEPDPAAAFGRVNSALQQLRQMDRFVTLMGVILDPAVHTVTLVNAGHPPPLLLRPGKVPVEAAPRASGGPAIGLFENASYTCCSQRLEPGDCIVLFSDGVTDAMSMSGRQFGRKGVEAAVRGCRTLPATVGQTLLDAINRHAANCSQSDDITLLCFGRTAEA